MNVLIIGGTGLISTAITRQADAADHDVTVFTRGETEADLPEAVDHIRGDRTDRDALERARDDCSLGCVIDTGRLRASDYRDGYRGVRRSRRPVRLL